MPARSSPETRGRKSAFELLVDVTILAPAGFGAALVEDAPRVIRRGREQVRVARFVGGMTVAYARSQVRRSFDVRLRPAVSQSTAIDGAEGAPSAARVSDTEALTSTLVLPDYDHLPAAHVVAKLGSLEPFERDAIETYERAHRHRRTILNRLEQLRSE
jgi:hypothetical protein